MTEEELKKIFYAKGQTYTRDEIAQLLSATTSGNQGPVTTFDFNPGAHVKGHYFTFTDPGTYINFLNNSGTAITIEEAPSGKRIINGQFYDTGSYYVATYNLEDKTDDLSNYPTKQEAALNTDILNLPVDLTKPLTANTTWNASTAVTQSQAGFKTTPLLNTTPNQAYTLQNITTSLTGVVNIGRCYDASNNFVANITASSLVAVTGGYKAMVPSNSNITKVGFNFRDADADVIILNIGSTVIAKSIKPALLPPPVTDNAQLANGRGFIDSISGLTKSFIFNNYIENLSIIAGQGYWSTSGTGFSVTDSTAYKHANPIPCVAGSNFTLQGLSASLSNTSVARIFNSAGTVIGSITPGSLSTITNGKLCTIPAISGQVPAFVGFHFSFAEAESIIINSGSTIVLSDNTIKQKYLPNNGNDQVARSNAEAMQILERGRAPKTYTLTGKYKLKVEGQSNSEGRSPAAQRPGNLPATLTGVKMFNRVSGHYADAQIAVNSGSDVASDNRNGMDWRLYQLLQAYRNDTIFVVKTAVGGCTLAYDPPVTSAIPGSFNVYFEKIKQYAADNTATLRVMLDESERNYIKSLKEDAVDGIVKDLKCTIWFQGESDRAGIKPDHPTAYYQNLKNWVAYQRGMTQNPQHKIVIIGIHKDNADYDQVVRDAQVKVCSEDPFLYFFNPDTLAFTSIGDNVHLDAACCDLYANGVFNIIKDF